MEIEIQLTNASIADKVHPPSGLGMHGAWVEFRGVVRAEENGETISALEYEAYPEMAVREIRRLLETISARRPCLAARVIHRLGVVPVGEAAIYIGVAARHRAEAIALLAEFMDRLKQDVPVWKRSARRAELPSGAPGGATRNVPDRRLAPPLCSLDEAMALIHSRCRPLPAVCMPLADAFGRVLRETVCAPEDLPSCDRSTRDGYAILQNDVAEYYQVVDTIHAADWKPRLLQSGESVRVATGAALPCAGLRVMLQENVELSGDRVKPLKRESALNLRKRGEDVPAGQPLVQTGVRLDAGKLALLATAGCVQPLVSPPLRIAHFTTGDEVVSPDQTPKPGQIHDSNSILIRGLLQSFPCDLAQKHLSENFDQAWKQLPHDQLAHADVILISGGASVGELDFTRPLLERLGFEIVFSQVNLRPGRPLIFGVNGPRVAFGLPGNPLSHFVCFHFAVATALARLTGESVPAFLNGRLAANWDDALCPRETLWPARLELAGPEMRLHPLPWASSGDITCFAKANALIRVPPNCALIKAGAEVDFLLAGGMLGR
jgi:molybdopterin molybdotransferase